MNYLVNNTLFRSGSKINNYKCYNLRTIKKTPVPGITINTRKEEIVLTRLRIGHSLAIHRYILQLPSRKAKSVITH